MPRTAQSASQFIPWQIYSPKHNVNFAGAYLAMLQSMPIIQISTIYHPSTQLSVITQDLTQQHRIQTAVDSTENMAVYPLCYCVPISSTRKAF